jgi:hypothetical protein
MGCLCYRQQDWLKELEISDAAILLYGILVRSGRGKGFAYPSMPYLMKKLKKGKRTIQRLLKELRENLLIASGRIMTPETERNGYAILPHPALLEWIKAVTAQLKTKVQVVIQDLTGVFIPSKMTQKTSEMTPLSNYREGSEVSLSPLTPQGGTAANAAKEKENVQETETEAPPPEKQDADTCGSHCGSGGHVRLPIAERGGDSILAGGLRVGPKIFQPTAAPARAAGACPPAQTCPAWQAALTLLLQQLPESEVRMWLEPIQATSTEKGLQLDCPDRFFCAWVQEHYETGIRDVLQRLGITDFYLSFGEQERELQEKKNRLIQAEAARRAEYQRQILRTLPLSDQFAALVAAYPRKTSEWLAWRTFKRLARRGELPELFELLQIISAKKQTDEWNRDSGRWIPGLSKWLNSRPWWKSDSKERRKESSEASSWGGKGSIHHSP